jgi:major type 1 subunit fimbrin (pilin)
MKKNLIAVAFAAVAAVSASNAFAAAGTVNFTGEILDAACTVDVASQDQTVALGSYSKSEFVNLGDVTAAKNFKILLKNCPAAVTSAHVLFSGTPDATNSDLLALTPGAGAATGVAINLLTEDQVSLPLSGDNSYRYTLVSTADNTLEYYAQYKSTVATSAITAGPANGVASFSVIYN